VETFYYNDLVDVDANVRDVQIHRDDDKVRDGDVRDVEDAVVPPPNEGESCGTDGRKQDESCDAPNDVPVFDTLGKKSRHGEEDEIEDCVQNEKKVDDTAKNLVSGFELLVGKSCDPLDWRVWRAHGQKIMQGQL
jgi:hypothetical protein